MLTFHQAMEIVSRSVRRIGLVTSFRPEARLKECEIRDDRLDWFMNDLAHEVEGAGYRISQSRLRSLDQHSTIYDVAQIIQLYSLAGDDTFEEPPDNEEEIASSE
jgi:hypothetical protein